MYIVKVEIHTSIAVHNYSHEYRSKTRIARYLKCLEESINDPNVILKSYIFEKVKNNKK